jgi:hypothetical protein
MTSRHWLLLLAGLIVGLLISGRFALKAQDRTETPQVNGDHSTRKKTAESAQSPAPSDIAADLVPRPLTAPGNQVAVTIQDALLRPYHFPFSRPTSLTQVCAHLKETLKAPVVLDLAALDRKSAKPDDTVLLELDGVRLKTGLKLLLDQVGLTFRVVAEDNLMIITDQEGAEDPAERIWAELRALHRDLHAVQDAVDELADYVGIEGAEGPRLRQPTIIEEMPENAGDKPVIIPEKPGRASEKPDETGAPVPGSRPLAPRVPLAGPRRAPLAGPRRVL